MSRQIDWAAEERKLQSVYDDIQYGRIKPAHAAVERWLKKHPRSQPALVLRMVLAEKQRLGAPAVLKVYEDVKRTAPLSGRSVWWITMTLRNIRRPDLVLALYQGLWDARPDVIELGDQVFLAAAAMGDTGVMAAVSRKLFNATKAPQWARIAAYSSWAANAPAPSDADPFPLAPPKTLFPAQLMLRTTGKEVRTADELWLRLEVALGAGDVTEAWRLVRDEGRKGSLARRNAAMDAAKVLGKRGVADQDVWGDEAAATIQLLRDDREAQVNYLFYRHLLTCVAAGASAKDADAVFADLEKEIGDKERAPALARLELDAAERKQGGGMGEDAWDAAVKAYLARWGSKWTTPSELLGVVGEDAAMAKRLRAFVQSARDSSKPHEDEKSFNAAAVAVWLLLRLGDAPTLDDTARYWKLYTDGLVYGANLPKTDVQPADPMGLAAVDALLAVWAESPQDDALLVHAAACLEAIVDKSPSSFSARFTLVRVYRLLGAPSLYVTHLDKLGLSEIQLDNLLHVVSERGGGLEVRLGGARKTWDDLAGKATLMYARSASDLPEFVKQALERESYSKIHGIRTLLKCLNQSIAQRVLEVEDVWASLATGADISSDTVASLAAALASAAPWVDNRNYELMVDSLAHTAAPHPATDEPTVRAFGAAAVRAARYVRGETATDVPSAAVDGLGDVDAAYVSALTRALDRAAAPDTEASDATFFDASVAAATAAQTTWARADALLALGRLARVLDAVGKRAAELAKPVKGKKRPAGLVALVADIKRAREGLESKVEGVLGALKEEGGEAGGKAFAAAGVLDDEAISETAKRVGGARAELVTGIRGLLGTKTV